MLLCHIDVDLFADLFIHRRLEMDDPHPLLGAPCGVVVGWRQRKSDDRSHQHRRRMLKEVSVDVDQYGSEAITYVSRQCDCTCAFEANLVV